MRSSTTKTSKTGDIPMPHPAARSRRPTGMALTRVIPALSTQQSASMLTPASLSRCATLPPSSDLLARSLGSSAAQRLNDAGVSMLALCWVDNAGITRVKAIPVGRLERAAGWGIGMSPVFDVFVVDDSITTSKHIGGPGGGFRFIPALLRGPPPAAPPGG